MKITSSRMNCHLCEIVEMRLNCEMYVDMRFASTWITSFCGNFTHFFPTFNAANYEALNFNSITKCCHPFIALSIHVPHFWNQFTTDHFSQSFWFRLPDYCHRKVFLWDFSHVNCSTRQHIGKYPSMNSWEQNLICKIELECKSRRENKNFSQHPTPHASRTLKLSTLLPSIDFLLQFIDISSVPPPLSISTFFFTSASSWGWKSGKKKVSGTRD